MSIYRILDVNINRASEGMRVLEEVSRFLLKNPKITAQLRNLRSSLIETPENRIKKNLYIKYRNIKEDFGKNFISRERKVLFDLVKANAKRAEEALRVLEEFSDNKETYLNMRFCIYEIEKKILSEMEGKGIINFNKLNLAIYVIHDNHNVLIKAIKNGAKVIQLRDKISLGKTLLDKAKKIKKYIDKLPIGRRPIFIINDSIDIALLTDADGVHLGQNDIGIKEAREILGIDKIIGKTTHNIKQGLKAQKEGASYISVGPVYKTPTKPGRPSVGLEYVKLAARKIKIPWVAIGGINKNSAKDVIKSGAKNLGIVRAYYEIKYLQKLLNKYYRRKK